MLQRKPPGFLRQTFMANGLCFNWLCPEPLKGISEVNTIDWSQPAV